MEYEEALRRFTAAVGAGDGAIDLARAALLIAAAEYPDMQVGDELAGVDSLAAAAARRVGAEKEPFASVNRLSEYLFDEMDFSGNADDYYDPRNSYLNDVMSRRVGIPITLSLVCVLVGDRIGVPLRGVGMPGHFLVRHRDEPSVIIDPFHRGIMLSEEECAERLRQTAGQNARWDPSFLDPVTDREFLARMLRNLKGIYLHRRDHPRAVDAMDFLVALLPDSPDERRDRGLIRYQLGRLEEALADLRFFLNERGEGAQGGQVRRLVASIEQRLR